MKTLSLTGLALLCLACRPPAPAPPDVSPASPSAANSAAADETARIGRAQRALAPLKSGLKQALMAAMPKGPVEAVSACRVEAPRIAGEISAGGIRVGRTSDRLRNATNAAQPWMLPLLDDYAAGSQESFRTASLPGGALGYVEPIRMQALCVTCHGSVLPEELAARLAELYPADQARGYAEGDFRGLFWAVVPAS